MSCFPKGAGRDRIAQAKGAMVSQAYVEQINVLMENTGACEVCAKNICSEALCHLLIKVFIKDYEPTPEEAEKFELGIVALCNSLITKHRTSDDGHQGHSTFHPSDN